ncbi:mechanosensitive ion channel family protein [Halochromatium sp.]
MRVETAEFDGDIVLIIQSLCRGLRGPRKLPLLALLLVLLPATILADATPVANKDAAEDAGSITTSDPVVPIDELELLLLPLSKDQLVAEASAWQQLVQQKAEQIARAEIAVKRQNREIKLTKELEQKAGQAQKEVEKVKEEAEKAAQAGDVEAAEKIAESARKAGESMRKLQQTADEAAQSADSLEIQEELTATGDAANKASEAVEHAEAVVADIEHHRGSELRDAAEKAKAAADEAVQASDSVVEQATEAASVAAESLSTEAIAETAAIAEQAKEEKQEQKVNLLEAVTELREERRQLIDRFDLVLDALSAKTAESDEKTLGLITDYRLYIDEIQGVKVDVADATSAWISIKGWLTSPSGGIKLAWHLASFIGILILAWVISRILGAGMHEALKRVPGTSRLLEDFLVRSIHWIVMAVGIIMALAAMDVSVGPLLAVVGATGFVVAFALQDSLSNFASGLMILFFKPFDVGDVVEAGGVSGVVQSMSLVSTTIQTFDNKRMVVPNNRIWNDVITNVTGVTERRVDMVFGIGYDDDMDRAQRILEEVIASHPKVLEDPAPTIRMHELADSSVNFIVRPWAKTGDYWDLYWDVHREVKRRFDAEGIGIPFPQRDVHLYLGDLATREALARSG